MQWDTAGQERYRTITNAYYKGSDGIIVVFDVTNRESFQAIPSWLKEIEKNTGDEVQIMVFANKADMDEEVVVTDKEIKEFEEQYKLPVIKTSARTGMNVDDSFLEMTKKLIVKKNENGGGADNRKQSMGLAFKRLQLGKDGGADSRSKGSSKESCGMCM